MKFDVGKKFNRDMLHLELAAHLADHFVGIAGDAVVLASDDPKVVEMARQVVDIHDGERLSAEQRWQQEAAGQVEALREALGLGRELGFGEFAAWAQEQENMIKLLYLLWLRIEGPYARFSSMRLAAPKPGPARSRGKSG